MGRPKLSPIILPRRVTIIEDLLLYCPDQELYREARKYIDKAQSQAVKQRHNNHMAISDEEIRQQRKEYQRKYYLTKRKATRTLEV